MEKKCDWHVKRLLSKAPIAKKLYGKSIYTCTTFQRPNIRAHICMSIPIGIMYVCIYMFSGEFKRLTNLRIFGTTPHK